MDDKPEQINATEQNGDGAAKQWLVDRVRDMGSSLHYSARRLNANIVFKDEHGKWGKHDENHPIIILSKGAGAIGGFLVGFQGTASLLGSLSSQGMGQAIFSFAACSAVAYTAGGVGKNVGNDMALTSVNIFRRVASLASENLSKSMVGWAKENGAKPPAYELKA